MPLTTVVISGRVQLPDESVPGGAVGQFTLSGMDTDAADGVVVVPAPVRATIGPDGQLTVNLWPTARGTRARRYSASVVFTIGNTPQTVQLGSFALPDDGGRDLVDLVTL